MRLNSFARTIVVLVAASGFLTIHLAAQTTQEPSIADAARRNREQKKAAATPATVITNDTLKPAASSAASAATAPATTPATSPATDATAPAGAQNDTTATAAPATAAKTELSPEDSQKLKEALAAMKEELKDKQSEVELSRRLLNLDREAILSKPDSDKDASGKAKLQSEQDELNQKEEEFTKLKAKFEALAPPDSGATTTTPPRP